MQKLDALETSLTFQRYERNSLLETLLYAGTLRQNSSPQDTAVETG